MGAVRILEAIREAGLVEKVRYYQASSSEMYGKVQEVPQVETTPFWPRSPYACAKVYAHWLTVNYRESYNMYASSGILFNHESPRRGETFVTRKITRAATRIKLGLQKKLILGNLDSKRDWGHAKDYVEIQWKMLQQENPEDFVIATGRQESVRRFIELSSKSLGWNKESNKSGIFWEGEGLNEVGKRADTGEVVIRIDPRYFRPTEVDILIGDPSKAKKELGWEPKISLDHLIKEMICEDLKKVKEELVLKEKGFDIFSSTEYGRFQTNKVAAGRWPSLNFGGPSDRFHAEW